MENDILLSKVKCDYAIISHKVNCEYITNRLEINPDRHFNKGDDSLKKSCSRRPSKRPYSLWALSKTIIGPEINISEHIKQFQDLLKNKIEIIKELTELHGCECIFQISIETEDIGDGFDLHESEMDFINIFASRFTCRFITKVNIG